jgi:4'-phosphopantetheinyl transferase
MAGLDMPTYWTKAPNDLNLETHQVDIWRISLTASSSLSTGFLPDSVQGAESSLSADESQRASRFHFDTDRHRFITSHIALRDVLSIYLHCEPRQIDYLVGDYGKPSVMSDLNIDFNLSHSGNFALIAISRDHKVGVDVEHFRPELEIEKIARRFFSDIENAELMSLHPELRVSGFFNCWTRKEAYIKAHGLGLSLPLDSFDVSLTPHEPALLRATRPDETTASRWTLLSLDVHPEYAGAVAVDGRDLEFRFWDV